MDLQCVPMFTGVWAKCIFAESMATGKQSASQLGEGLAPSRVLSIVTALALLLIQAPSVIETAG